MSEQDSREENPSFFAIIPADVRYDKKLCSSAKLLYGEITALTQKEGYCWASNKYFAELYEVDISTIKRWIKNLADEQYIETETVKNGMHWDRKIFLKNILRRLINEPSKAQKRADRRLKNEPILVHSTNKKENNNNPPQAEPPDSSASPPVVVSPLLENLKISEKLKAKITKEHTQEAIKKALLCLDSMQPDSVEATLITALKEKWQPKTDKTDVIKARKDKATAWTNDVEDEAKKKGAMIYVTSEAVLIASTQAHGAGATPKPIYFKSSTFFDELNAMAKTWQLPKIEGRE